MDDAVRTILELMSKQCDREWRGLELVEDSEGKLKRAIIYGHLYAMSKQGLVIGIQDETVPNLAGVPTVFWKITKKGVGALADYLQNEQDSQVVGGINPQPAFAL